MSAHIEVKGSVQVKLRPGIIDAPVCEKPRYDSESRTVRVPDSGVATMEIPRQGNSAPTEILIVQLAGAHPQTAISVADKISSVVQDGNEVDASIEGLREQHVLSRGETAQLRIGKLKITIGNGTSKSNPRRYCASHLR